MTSGSRFLLSRGLEGSSDKGDVLFIFSSDADMRDDLHVFTVLTFRACFDVCSPG